MTPLVPNPRAFTVSHPLWLTDVASLVACARVGTTFGLYGRWGSGKSSAALALIPAIYKAAHENGTVTQVVVVDATSLRGTEKDSESVARAINEEVSFATSSTISFAQMRKTAYQAIGAFTKVVAASPDPVTKGLAHSLDVLSEQGATLAGRELHRQATEIESSAELDQVVVIFDDLDRCSPDVAVRILETAVTPALQRLATTIVVCDPGVLAAHAAAVFGVPVGDGLRAVAKYVHVAVHVPASSGPTLTDAFLGRIPPGWAGRQDLALAAQSVAKLVPIRDVLTALPQSYLWLCAMERVTRVPSNAVTLVMSLSVISTALPQLFEVMQRSPTAVFRELLLDYIAGRVLKRESRFNSLLSEPVRAQLGQRVDLIELGTRLGRSEVDNEEAHHILIAIKGITR